MSSTTIDTTLCDNNANAFLHFECTRYLPHYSVFSGHEYVINLVVFGIIGTRPRSSATPL